MNKRFFGLIFALIVVGMMSVGCESIDRKEAVDDSRATSILEETILWEDIIVEEIIGEEIIENEAIRQARIDAHIH